MTGELTMPNPKKVAGLALIIFGGWLGLEGALMLSIGQFLVAGSFVTLGWFLRKRGATGQGGGSSGQRVREWMQFSAFAVPVLIAAYLLGYLALMDRHRPTSPSAEFVRFESSFRFAPREWVHKAQVPYQAPWGSVTTWNILYQPMDRLWFHYFPRSQQEIAHLRKLGYRR